MERHVTPALHTLNTFDSCTPTLNLLYNSSWCSAETGNKTRLSSLSRTRQYNETLVSIVCRVSLPQVH